MLQLFTCFYTTHKATTRIIRKICAILGKVLGATMQKTVHKSAPIFSRFELLSSNDQLLDVSRVFAILLVLFNVCHHFLQSGIRFTKTGWFQSLRKKKLSRLTWFLFSLCHFHTHEYIPIYLPYPSPTPFHLLDFQALSILRF